VKSDTISLKYKRSAYQRARLQLIPKRHGPAGMEYEIRVMSLQESFSPQRCVNLSRSRHNNHSPLHFHVLPGFRRIQAPAGALIHK
jgi:hypothetical protein